MDSRELAMRLDRLQESNDRLLELEGIRWNPEIGTYIDEEEIQYTNSIMEETNGQTKNTENRRKPIEE